MFSNLFGRLRNSCCHCLVQLYCLLQMLSLARVAVTLFHSPFSISFLSMHQGLIKKIKIKGKKATNQMKAEWVLFAGCGLAPTGHAQHVPLLSYCLKAMVVCSTFCGYICLWAKMIVLNSMSLTSSSLLPLDLL